MKSCLFSLMVVGLVSGAAWAQDGSCPASSCPGSSCPGQSAVVSTQDGVVPQTQTAEATCPITEGMKLLPAIHYWVGEQEACCANSAAAMAKAKELPVVYKVGEHSFDTEEAAFMGLIEATEKFVNAFATPHTCEVSGKTFVAGEACDCPVKAGERAELVKAAMEAVSLTCKVGEETCACPVSAREMAEKSGQPVTYVIGDEQTSCEHMARLKLAQARYKAALVALHNANGATSAAPAQTLTSEIR